jgi:hypothetical protein
MLFETPLDIIIICHYKKCFEYVFNTIDLFLLIF